MVIDKMPRRVFLVGTFYLATALLALLTLNTLGSTAVVLVFGLFALVLSAAANLEFVYPPERAWATQRLGEKWTCCPAFGSTRR
jgi:putative MFS transporter